MQNQWVVKSLAVWGIIIATISGALPGLESLLPMLNPEWQFSVAPEWISSLDESVKNIISGAGVAVGSIMVIIDRVTGSAKKTLTFRR
jgi:hypothetical protein